MKILMTFIWLLPFLFGFGFASNDFIQNSSLQCFVPGIRYIFNLDDLKYIYEFIYHLTYFAALMAIQFEM